LFRENLHDLQRAVGMEPFMEPSGSERALEASEMDGIRALFGLERAPTERRRRSASDTGDGFIAVLFLG
jgi:hypothetical protein